MTKKNHVIALLWHVLPLGVREKRVGGRRGAAGGPRQCATPPTLFSLDGGAAVEPVRRDDRRCEGLEHPLL